MNRPDRPTAAPVTASQRNVRLASSLSWLALAYVFIHTVFSALARRHVAVPWTVFLADAGLLAAFIALNFVRVPSGMANRSVTHLARLWVPLIFFWFAYKWSQWTLYSFFPEGVSFDEFFITWDGYLFGQPAAWLSIGRPPWLTELLHGGYVSYYMYTPLVGIYLSFRRRFDALEQFLFAVVLGYFVSYPMFALLPVWGPRWALIEAGLVNSIDQRLTGYWLTHALNKIMWDGVALKGGAMPSSHSSTAIIFCTWCWKLWGRRAGVPATLLVATMFIGAVYGRYHYVIDVVLGIGLGVASMWLASKLRHDTVRDTMEANA